MAMMSNTEHHPTAGPVLRQWLRDNRRTLRSFAIEMGCTEGTVLRWCQGQVPRGFYLAKVVTKTGLPLSTWV
jgi:hypothetical protein